MDVQTIKTSKTLTLKENGIFADTSIPYNYQKRPPLLMLLRPRMVLGDDCGLGKTLETILLMSYLKAHREDTKFLVLTERLAVKQWWNSLEWLAPTMTKRIITAETHKDIPSRVRAMRTHGVDVVISGYGLLYNYAKYLKEGMGPRWVFIADEPDYFKNPESAMHIAAFEMVNGEGGAARAYGLTATIVGNRLLEAFGILRIIAPGALGSNKEFERDYCKMKRIKGVLRVVGYKNLGAFRQKIEPVFYGRLQTDPEVEQELPDVIPKDVEVVMSKEQSWKIVEVMDKIISMPDGEVRQLGILQAMIMAQLLVDDPRVKGFNIVGAKTLALIETLEHSLSGERVVIFSKYRRVIDLLEKEMEAKGLTTVRITGAENLEQRERSKTRFISDGPDRVPILLVTRAARRAIDGLQKSGFVFFFDMPWGYDDYRQLVGRLKRTGSTFKKVLASRMLAVLHPDVASQVGTDRTIDHYTLKVVMDKFKLWQAITGDAEELDTTESDVVDVYEEIKKNYKAKP